MNRRHPLLAFAAVLLGFAALLPTASTASAAPPDNDDISGATVLGPVPFHLEQDTTEATTSAEEAAFNDFCGAPASNTACGSRQPQPRTPTSWPTSPLRTTPPGSSC